MLVPLIVLCRAGLGQEESTPTPGPAMSTFPPQEKEAIRSRLSRAPTDRIVGEFAGAIVGAITAPGRLLALPAAAMIKQPAAKLPRPPQCRTAEPAVRPPRDIEIDLAPVSDGPVHAGEHVPAFRNRSWSALCRRKSEPESDSVPLHGTGRRLRPAAVPAVCVP